MAEQLLSCEHPTSRNPSSKKQGNKPARTAGKRPVRQLRYLRLTIFDSLWRLCVSFFLSVARRRLQQFAASFRQPPHAGDWLLLPAGAMWAWTCHRLSPRSAIAINRDHTLQEVGRQSSWTRERIRQIEAKALRKLKHPSRSRTLRSFLDN